MVDKSKLAIATSQPQNPIPFLIELLFNLLSQIITISTIKLTCHPMRLADRAKKFRVNSRAIFYAFKRMKITRKKTTSLIFLSGQENKLS
jgi:hypothetical protein